MRLFRAMKLGLVLSALLLISKPVFAVDYQGKNIDDRMLNAKAYNYETGGVYDVQVKFKKDKATLYFTSGETVTLRLSQQVITDPSSIQAFGRLGFLNPGGIFNFGLYNDDISNRQPAGQNPLAGFWTISLDKIDVDAASKKQT